MKTTTSVGRYGEEIACDYLQKRKYKIKEQNYYASHNEIDIIAENKQYIVFVEVKTRTYSKQNVTSYGTPATAVTYSKQKRTLAAAQAYLIEHPTSKTPRMDVIEVYLSEMTWDNIASVIKINHIEDAFSN